MRAAHPPPAVAPRLLVGRMVGTRSWLPLLTLTSAIGLAGVSVAFTGARAEAPWSLPLFWAGMLLLFAPAAARVLSAGATRAERIGILLMLAMGLYLVKVIHSPAGFTFYDELQHWRTVVDIAQQERLFVENPLLRTSPLFPGLEVATQAIMSLTGLSPFVAGLVVVAAAKVVLVLAVFGTFELVSSSARVAAAGALIYIANPSFLFFDSQFAYESFALPMAALLIFLVALRLGAPVDRRVGLTLLAMLALATVVTSHHLTTFVLVAFLVGWALTRVVLRRAPGMGPGGMAMLSVVAAAGWVTLVATFTVSYLAAPLGNTVVSLIRIITREQAGRQLFEGAAEAAIVAPTWERLTGFAAVGLLLLALPVGLWRIYHDLRDRPLAIFLGVAALGYPASLALRFSSSGAEAAARASATLFVAVGLVVGLALVGHLLARASAWRLAAATAFVSVVFMGGVIVGWPPWNRLPGPYLVGANSRSIEEEGISAATWMLARLGPNNRFVADSINNLLMGSYGRQYSVWYQTARVDMSPVYFAPSVGPDERRLLAEGDVAYLVADTRLSRAVPQTGVYFDSAEARAHGPHEEPIPLERLAKFDRTDGMSRIFDSGHIRVYDVSEAAR
jgi:hypothetical protein